MTIKLQYFIIVVGLLLAAGTGMYFYQEHARDALIKNIKEDLQEEKELAIKERDTALARRDETITQLIEQNEKAKADSKYWYQQAQRRGVNPDYDLDFLTSADILAKSKYKPGE